MKKLLTTFLISGLCLAFTCTKAEAIDDVIQRAYDNGLTRYSTRTDFAVDRNIRRDEAAKFMVQFAKLKGKTYVKSESECQFGDMYYATEDLIPFITESCMLGIFNGVKAGTNTRFYPEKNLTNAEAVAVVMRIIDGKQYENGLTHRADNYYERANVFGILSNLYRGNLVSQKDNVAIRGNVVNMIFWAGGNMDSIKDIVDADFYEPTLYDKWMEVRTEICDNNSGLKNTFLCNHGQFIQSWNPEGYYAQPPSYEQVKLYRDSEMGATKQIIGKLNQDKEGQVLGFHLYNFAIIDEYYKSLDLQLRDDALALQYDGSDNRQTLQQKYGNICGIALDDRSFPGYLGNSMYWFYVYINNCDGTVTQYKVIKQLVNAHLKGISSEDYGTFNIDTIGQFTAKPVIYLYPIEKKEIKVGINFNGNFTVTYPEISENNDRIVIAQPDGTLINKADGLEYSYLFREGEAKNPYEITEGFVVKHSDTVSFLQEKLAYLGLTPREYNEFIVYWRPIMKKNKYNLIKFLGEEYTSQAQLTISPKPDSIQRVFMVFKGLDEPVEVKEQVLKPFVRSGFAVIERGGSEI